MNTGILEICISSLQYWTSSREGIRLTVLGEVISKGLSQEHDNRGYLDIQFGLYKAVCFWSCDWTRAWITWAGLASRFTDDQQAFVYAIWHIYGAILAVLVVVLAVSCARDEHFSGRDECGGITQHMHVIYQAWQRFLRHRYGIDSESYQSVLVSIDSNRFDIDFKRVLC